MSSGLLLLLDLVWVALYAGPKFKEYGSQFGNVSKTRIAMFGLAAYTLMVVGMCVFVASANPCDALLKGALFGVCVYGIFDFTNMAFLPKYPLQLAAIDILWGTFVFAFSAWAGSSLAKHASPRNCGSPHPDSLAANALVL